MRNRRPDPRPSERRESRARGAPAAASLRALGIAGLLSALASLAPAEEAAPKPDDAPPGPVPAPGPAPDPAPAIDVQGAFLGGNFKFYVQGAAPLPGGTILRIDYARVERGRRIPGSEGTHFVEVKVGRFESSWGIARLTFHPGMYMFDVTLKSDQPAAVAVALTKAQREFKLATRLDVGGERQSVVVALEVSRPLLQGLRALSADSPALAKHAAAAAEGKLTKGAWATGRSGVGPAVESLEKLLARKDLRYHLPASPGLLPLLGRARAALQAYDDVAEGRAAGPPTVSFPSDEELARAMIPVHLDVLCLFNAVALDLQRDYAVCNDTKKEFISIPPPEAQAQAKLKIDAALATWPAVKALDWRTGLAPALHPLGDAQHAALQCFAPVKPQVPAVKRLIEESKKLGEAIAKERAKAAR
jgi:hypothetical protein